MEKIRLGIIKEGKLPYDKRVAFTPAQCVLIEKKFPAVKVFVQSSAQRCYPDADYASLGISVVDDISVADILMGIKEVPAYELIPGKTYLFFSHTIKKQPRNKELLQEILKRNIRLIDYECLTDIEGNRVIGFGRYAGIVGAYNGILGYGLQTMAYTLNPAHTLINKTELDEELKKVHLPDVKIIITGGGRVANGATEIMGALKIRRVTPYEFLNYTFHEPVYTRLHSKDYNTPKDGSPWNSKSFYEHPENFTSTFDRYTRACDILMHCAFWHPSAPVLFTAEEMKSETFKITFIADITCDINGSIPSTIRASTIESPFYGYQPLSGKEEAPFTGKAINIMAVDNLPCELPKDASDDFGKNLFDLVLPSLLIEDANRIIERATITMNGQLTASYRYLQDYIA